MISVKAFVARNFRHLFRRSLSRGTDKSSARPTVWKAIGLSINRGRFHCHCGSRSAVIRTNGLQIRTGPRSQLRNLLTHNSADPPEAEVTPAPLSARLSNAYEWRHPRGTVPFVRALLSSRVSLSLPDPSLRRGVLIRRPSGCTPLGAKTSRPGFPTQCRTTAAREGP